MIAIYGSVLELISFRRKLAKITYLHIFLLSITCRRRRCRNHHRRRNHPYNPWKKKQRSSNTRKIKFTIHIPKNFSFLLALDLQVLLSIMHVALVGEAQNCVILRTFQSVTRQNAVCDAPNSVHKNFEHQRKWIQDRRLQKESLNYSLFP